MNAAIAVLIIIVLFVVGFGGIYIYYNGLPSIGPQPTSGLNITPQPVEFVDTERGYSIYSPAGWTKDIAVSRSLGLRVMFVGPQFGDFITNVNVGTGYVSEGGVDQFANSGPQDPFVKDYKLVSYKTVTIGNQAAKEVVYTANINNYKSKSKQVFVPKGDTMYIIAYVALGENYDQFLPLTQKSIDSF